MQEAMLLRNYGLSYINPMKITASHCPHNVKATFLCYSEDARFFLKTLKFNSLWNSLMQSTPYLPVIHYDKDLCECF